MGKKYKKNIEVKKTIEIVIDEYNLSCLIANAMGSTCGFDWWDYDDDEYEKTKKELVAELGANPKDGVCVEDVLARMLLNGKKIKLLEAESDWHWSGHKPNEMLWKAQIVAEGCVPVGGKWHEVGIDDIVKGIQLYGESGCANACGPSLRNIVEDGDFYDADAVFQCAAYGEVVFG